LNLRPSVLFQHPILMFLARCPAFYARTFCATTSIRPSTTLFLLLWATRHTPTPWRVRVPLQIVTGVWCNSKGTFFFETFFSPGGHDRWLGSFFASVESDSSLFFGSPRVAVSSRASCAALLRSCGTRIPQSNIMVLFMLGFLYWFCQWRHAGIFEIRFWAH